MPSRHTVRGSGLGDGKSYDAIRRNYRLRGDEERERATQQSPEEIIARLHEQIAEQHPALVAAYRTIPPAGSDPATLRAIGEWKREHRAGIEEAKTWPR